MKTVEGIIGIIFLLFSGSLGKLPYILGGTQARIEDCPYQVAIVVRHYPYGEWLKGGGTIITRRFVITSGSVVAFISEKMFTNGFVYVYANSVYWRNGTAHKVKDCYKDSSFSEITFEHDIAVIQVETPFQGEYEKSIRLAGSNYQKFHEGVISGWGTKTHYPVKLEDILQKLKVSIIELTSCEDIYNQPGNAVRVAKEMMCSLNPGKGSCQGDGGGPLVHNRVLVGIISWNRKCGDMLYPSVYTNISAVWSFLRRAEEKYNMKFPKTFRF